MSTIYPFIQKENSISNRDSKDAKMIIKNNNIVSDNEQLTPIEEKNSPILQQRKSSDQSTIPSPPLSPYQRNSELIHKSTIPLINDSLFNDKIFLTRDFTKGEFPIEKLSKRSLSINPWTNINSNNYKNNHLKFLSNYKCFHNKLNNRVTKRYNTIPRTRRIIHHITSDLEYSSSSDFEKVRTRRMTSKEQPLQSIPSTTTSTPSPKKPKVRVARSETPQVVVDYESIPDYSPLLSTLPNNNRCLKQEWKGQPMSLLSDPLMDKLHPAELTLLSILRLPCSVYLDSKRRLFLEKVNRMKRGLPFRRTDAQKLCKIDVNKASRLFAAFEKVGWLNEDHFTKFM